MAEFQRAVVIQSAGRLLRSGAETAVGTRTYSLSVLSRRRKVKNRISKMSIQILIVRFREGVRNWPESIEGEGERRSGPAPSNGDMYAFYVRERNLSGNLVAKSKSVAFVMSGETLANSLANVPQCQCNSVQQISFSTAVW